jgi:hypothetical protein
MSINAVQQGAFRGSSHFQEAVAAVVMERAIYLIATAPPEPTAEQLKELAYAKVIVQGRRSPTEMLVPLVASNTWNLTFDAWATAEAAGDRYAIGAGIQELWLTFADSL